MPLDLLADRYAGYDRIPRVRERESLLKQFALAPLRGVEGALQGIYQLADFLTFDALPDYNDRFLGRSEHWAASLLEGGMQFLLPFAGTTKALSWMGRTTRLGRAAAGAIETLGPKSQAVAKWAARDLVGGGVVDFAAFAGDQGRLADVLKQHPQLNNALVEWLATDEDESFLEGRLKNVVEGGVLGSAFDGLLAAFKGLKKADKLRATGAPEATIQKALGESVDQRAVRSSLAGLWRERFGYDHDVMAATEAVIDHVLPDHRARIVADENGQVFAEWVEKGGEIRKQGAEEVQGYTFFRDGQAVIGAFRNPDASTGVHELAHVARRFLFDRVLPAEARIGVTDEMIDTAAGWAGARQDAGQWEWSAEAEEKFARGFERYLRDGKAPRTGLRALFDRMASFLRNVYQSVTGSAIDVEVSAEMRGVFDALLQRGDLPEVRAQVGQGAWGESVLRRAVGEETPLPQARDPLLRAMQGRGAWMTLESMPGDNTGHLPEAFGAPWEQRLELHRATFSALVDPTTGEDVVARELGTLKVLEGETLGFFEGNVSPARGISLAGAFDPNRPWQLSAEGGEAVSTYATTVAILTRQKALAWHTLSQPENLLPRDANGIAVDLRRRLELDDYRSLIQEAADRLGWEALDAIPLVGTLDGLHVLNLGTSSLGNTRFQSELNAVLEAAFGQDILTAHGQRAFRSQTAYRENNWGGQKNGEGYLDWLEQGHGGGARQRSEAVLRRYDSRVARAQARLASRFGWTVREDLNAAWREEGRELDPLLQQGGQAFDATNARRPSDLPYEPINLDRVSSSADVAEALHRALSGDWSTLPASGPTRSLEEVAAEAVDQAEEVAGLMGETLPHQVVRALTQGQAEKVAEVSRQLQAARVFLANLGQQHADFLTGKLDPRSGEWRGTRIELAEAIRRRDVVLESMRQVRLVQRAQAQALGAHRIRYSGDLEAAVPVRGSLLQEPASTRPAAAVEPDAGPDAVKLAQPIDGEAAAEALIQAHGGERHVRQLLAQDLVYREINPSGILASKARSKWAALPEYWINNILSGPITHAVNLTGGVFRGLIRPIEMALGAVASGQGGLARQELAELAHAAHETREALKLAWHAFRSDDSILIPEGGQALAEHKVRGQRAISATNLGLSQDSIAGRVMNWAGGLVNLPSRFLTAEDEFFKQLSYRSKVSRRIHEVAVERFVDPRDRAAFVEKALAAIGDDGQFYTRETLRRRAGQAAAERGLSGRDAEEFVRAFIADNWDKDLALAAQEARQAAREATFTEELTGQAGSRGLTSFLTRDRARGLPGASLRGSINELGTRLSGATAAVPALRFIFPFIRTPTNLLQFFLDRSVGAVSDTLRVVVDGEARRALTPAGKADLLGRLATGSALFFTAASFASMKDENGLPLLTGAGPTDPDERAIWEATGWQPYSIRVGDRYVSYRRIDPAAFFFGLVADVVQEQASAELLNRDPSFGKAAMIALVNNLVSKTYLTGALNVARLLNSPEQEFQYVYNSLVSGFAPASSFVYQAVNPALKGDRVFHELRSVKDAFRARWIGSDPSKLPVRRNVFGEALKRDAGIGPDWLSPLRYVESSNDQLMQEMVRIGAGFGPPRKQDLGVDWTQVQGQDGQTAYDRWLENHGTARIGGRTLRESLERAVRSRAYRALPRTGVNDLESPRVQVLRRILSTYRQVAKAQTLGEFPELAGALRDRRLQKLALRSGAASQ